MRLTLLVVLLLAGVAASPAERPVPKRTPPVAVIVNGEKHTADVREAIDQLFDGTNRLRQDAGRSPLVRDPALATAAGAFAEFMARTEQYGHEADGSNPSARATKAGYDACIVAENIAYQYLSTGFRTGELAQSLLDAWMDSPGHRANLLSPDITELGVAIARSPRSGKYYGVQLFGRPRSQSVEFTVRNSTDVALAYELDGESQALPVRGTVRHLLCRPAALVFHWPGKQPATTIESQAQRVYDVVRAGPGEFRVDTGRERR